MVFNISDLFQHRDDEFVHLKPVLTLGYKSQIHRTIGNSNSITVNLCFRTINGTLNIIFFNTILKIREKKLLNEPKNVLGSIDFNDITEIVKISLSCLP